MSVCVSADFAFLFLIFSVFVYVNYETFKFSFVFVSIIYCYLFFFLFILLWNISRDKNIQFSGTKKNTMEKLENPNLLWVYIFIIYVCSVLFWLLLHFFYFLCFFTRHLLS